MRESLLNLIAKEESFFPEDERLENEHILKALNRNGLVLKYIEHPTSEMIKAALKQNGMALQYVADQTEEICLLAVKSNGRSLQFVRQQTDSICRAAIMKYAPSFLYVEDQTEELALLAIQKDARVFRLVKKQTLALCREAIKKDGLLFRYVEEVFQTDEIIHLAVKQNTAVLPFLTAIKPWMIFEAIKRGDGDLVSNLPLTERNLNEWLKTNPKKIMDCSVLTEEAIWTLMRHGTTVSQWIGAKKSPSDSTREFLLWSCLIEGNREKRSYYLGLWPLNQESESYERLNQFLEQLNPYTYLPLPYNRSRRWYFEALLMTDEECLRLIKKEPIRVLTFDRSRLTESFCFSMVQVNLEVYRYLPLEYRTVIISRYVVSRDEKWRLISPYHGEEVFYQIK